MMALVPGRAGVRVRLAGVPLARHRRLSVDHHAGAQLRADARVLPQRHGLRRQQRLHRLQGHPRLRPAAGQHARRAARASRPSRSRRATCACRADRRVARRPRDPRDPRRREPHAVPRLSASSRTSSGCSSSRRSSPASPARCTCRRSASSTRASSRRSTRSKWSSGSRSAAAARSTAPPPARCWSTTPRPIFTGALPEVWLYALGALFVLVTLFLPRGAHRACCRRAARAR